MINRIATVAFVPLLAAFIGWSIQPLPGAPALTSDLNQASPEPTLAQNHASPNVPSAAPKNPAHDVVASNQ